MTEQRDRNRKEADAESRAVGAVAGASTENWARTVREIDAKIRALGPWESAKLKPFTSRSTR